MSWNHRVMRTTYDDDEVTYTVREVYYSDDGEIEGWTAEPIAPQGETADELRKELERMLACTKQPVLDEECT